MNNFNHFKTANVQYYKNLKYVHLNSCMQEQGQIIPIDYLLDLHSFSLIKIIIFIHTYFEMGSCLKHPLQNMKASNLQINQVNNSSSKGQFANKPIKANEQNSKTMLKQQDIKLDIKVQPLPPPQFHSQKFTQQKFKKPPQLSDEEIQGLLSEGAFKAPELYCDSKNKVERYCTNVQCKFDAMCCSKEQCNHCQILHQNCPLLELKRLNKKVQEKIFINKKILRNLFAFQNQLINKLISNRKKMILETQTWRLGGKTIQSIYFNNITKGLKGNDMKILFAQLSEKLDEFCNTEQYVKSYKKEGEKLIQQLEKARKNVILGLAEQEKKKAINTKILSKILLSEDKQGKEKWTFLIRQLNNPTSLKLLFRASQHNFRAAKFHQYCDDISDTVTIVRTKFGKTIAAYTPLKWSSPSNWKPVADNSNRSFLLQLELKQRMTLIKPEQAIYNHRDWGPVFGGDSKQLGDLCIRDQYSQSKDSCCNFPFSYNCGGKYQKNQQSCTVFCGNPDDSGFRILEYEVFAVK